MSNYTQEDFIKDIIKDFKKAQNKIEQKKKMRELIKLYGTTRKEIENKSTMTDWFSYLFAGGDDILKAVNEENRLKQALDNSNSKTSTYGSSLDDEDMEKNAKNVQKQLIKQQYHTPKRQDTLSDKIAEKIATSDTIKYAVLSLQGMADSYFNPVGMTLRLNNYIQNNDFNTGLEHFEPQNSNEAIAEILGGALYEAIPAAYAGIPTLKNTANYTKTAIKESAENIADGRKLGKAYDLVKKNPTQGKPTDILAKFDVRGRKVGMTRGAATIENGTLITQGRALKRATGVERNHGLTKEIFLHDVSKRDVKKLPKLLRQNTPTETTPSGKQIYNTKSILGKKRISVTKPSPFTDEVDDIISSDYWLDVPKTPRTPWK